MAFVDLTPYILSFSEWVADQGAWGPVYYALLLALWVMMCLPCRQVPAVTAAVDGGVRGGRRRFPRTIAPQARALPK